MEEKGREVRKINLKEENWREDGTPMNGREMRVKGEGRRVKGKEGRKEGEKEERWEEGEGGKEGGKEGRESRKVEC